MITDHLKYAKMYEGVTRHIHLAFAFLRRDDLLTLPNGRHEIAGDDAYALVQDYVTKPAEPGMWEAHRKYVDVQYVASGVERMGYAPIGAMRVTKDYDEAGDYQLFTGDGNDLVMTPGMFAVFSPQDVHRPTVAVDRPVPVRKIVVKVRVD
jgi:biofilm protein TabA